MEKVTIKEVSKHLGQDIQLQSWVFNFRSSGKIFFLQLRDGTGRLQAVISKNDVSEDVWKVCEEITMESSVIVTGVVNEEKRSPFGFEMQVKDIKVLQVAEEYPIAKKEHGIDFLLDNRHLWLRSERQATIMRVRDEIIWLMREFFRNEGFVLTDSPILTPTSCEGTTTLFSTEYFDETAYLSQSGQLYLEACAMALGKVYDFGPTFRAEKSKTRRHMMEFWMLDAEAAFMQHDENLKVQEKLVSYVVVNILKSKKKELKLLGRDTKFLEKVKAPFPRMKYSEAINKLHNLGSDIKEGEDLGADDETMLMKEFDQPVFVTHYPTKIKAFYMQPDPENPNQVLCDDLLAPEGYGEIIGGSERIWDLKLLEQRIKEHKLSQKDFEWYVDLRRYGSVPHAGFGIGLERTVAWICGLDHVRETIPFPRLLNRLKP
ncbi:asparagine--tRNA ligase [Patescibacteria group bacterium]|nr:asparagine--tRNA ligase [Patescibacteria group bacterium]MBU1075388.1 asparagine--tRNA ligase [Patescibacteria group bacterium]MBU1951339.1 asparagine--tRNA ligase [Patescibacteria group bacterium]